MHQNSLISRYYYSTYIQCQYLFDFDFSDMKIIGLPTQVGTQHLSTLLSSVRCRLVFKSESIRLQGCSHWSSPEIDFCCFHIRRESLEESHTQKYLNIKKSHSQILAQIIWSRERPVEFLLDILQNLLDVQQDFTGRPLEFCKFASKVLEWSISSRNAIKISTGRPVKFLLDVHQNVLDIQ